VLEPGFAPATYVLSFHRQDLLPLARESAADTAVPDNSPAMDASRGVCSACLHRSIQGDGSTTSMCEDQQTPHSVTGMQREIIVLNK
jgi:hypothetical protein